MMNIKKWWAKSKTLWFAAALAALGALEAQIHIIPEQYRGHVLIAISAAVAVLRIVTTQPVGGKGK